MCGWPYRDHFSPSPYLHRRAARSAPPAAAAPPSSPPPVRQLVGDEGWILVRSRHGSGSPRPPSPRTGSARSPQQSPAPYRPAGTAVQEALRRGQEERRASDARRARVVEQALEARRAKSTPVTPESPRAEKPPPMGPPPPPPRRRSPPHPSAATVEAPPSQVPELPAAQNPRPPPSRERPTKRTVPWEGSPSEEDGPRTRQRFQPGSTGGRSSSADARLRQGHVRIQYGDSVTGAADFF